MTLSTFTHPTLAADDAAEVLRAGGFEFGPSVERNVTVLDTFDARLFHADLQLLRIDGATLELRPTGSSGLPATANTARPVRFAADLPIGPLRSRLHAITDVRAFGPVLELTELVRTGARRNKAGATVATAVLHEHVAVRAVPAPGAGRERVDSGTRKPRAWAIEVREHTGHAAAAERVAAALTDAGCAVTAGGFVELLTARWGVDLAGVDLSPTVPLSPEVPAAPAVRAVLANLNAAIEANWEGTLHDIDPEFLHDLRVAIRRTRSVLTAAKKVFPDDARNRFREEFGWLAGVTGRPRDLDVYVIEWDRYVSPLPKQTAAHLEPVLAHLQRHRESAHDELVDAMRSARTTELRRVWRDWLAGEGGDDGGHEAGDEGSAETAATAERPTRVAEPIGHLVARLIRAAHDTVIENGRAIGASSPGERLHDLRKDAKKLRYLLECFGSLLPAKERKAYVNQLKALQDNLGEHQDAEVHASELREVAHELERETTSPDTLMALGQLSEHLDHRRRSTRAEFADRFAVYDSRETRDALRALLKRVER